MTEEQAIQIVQGLLRTVQKARSNIHDELFGPAKGNENDPILKLAQEKLLPWMLGKDNALLEALLKMDAAIDNGKGVNPQELYNVVLIATVLEPQIGLLARALFEVKLPRDPASILRDPWRSPMTGGAGYPIEEGGAV